MGVELTALHAQQHCPAAVPAWLDCVLCSISSLLQPAIQLAEAGFPAHPYLGGCRGNGCSPRCRCCCCRPCHLCFCLLLRPPVAPAQSQSQLLQPFNTACAHLIVPAVATLSGENQTAALLQWPAVRDTFLIREGKKARCTACHAAAAAVWL